MMESSPPRVLRGITPEPYTFDLLGANGEVISVATPPSPAPSQKDMEDAFEQGRKAGLRERQNEVAALQEETVRLAQDLKDGIQTQREFVQHAADRLGEEWRQTLRQLEPTLAAIAIEIAEAVLDAPLADAQREATDQAIADAVDGLAGDAPLSVMVHPVTLLHLQETGMADSLQGAHPRLRWEPDNTIAEDDWAASTPEAAIRRIRASMLASLRERLGLEPEA